VRAYLLFLLLSICISSQAGDHEPLAKRGAGQGVLVTKRRLTTLIDSVLDLETIYPQQLKLINYYTSILKSNNADTVRLQPINLKQLNFYTEQDEKALFPVTPFSELPKESKLIIENGHLSYFSMPYSGILTSNYGWREGKVHKGIDIDLRKGDQVVSAFDGKVRIARVQGGYGNVVVIMHPNGLETVYAHLSKLKVKPGEVVRSGQVIGLGGNTGHSSGSHLHFEIRYQGHALNPALVISVKEQKLFDHSLLLYNDGKSLNVWPANSRFHNIQKGENWSVIAKNYGMSLHELLSLNGTAQKFVLRAGKKIRVS
jgi:murein DD-endopeptidase MepM/ murein hydrolase activator NlpD